jgi:hypothetical protein
LRKTVQLSVGADVKIPLYRNDNVGKKFNTYQGFFPKPGDDQIDVTGWVFVGGGLPHTKAWIEGGVGYRHRSSQFMGWTPPISGVTLVDGLPFTATFGATAGRFIGMVKVDGIVNVKTDLYTREGVAVGPALMVDVAKGFAVEARFADEVWVAQASRGVSFGAGVSWRTK